MKPFVNLNSAAHGPKDKRNHTLGGCIGQTPGFHGVSDLESCEKLSPRWLMFKWLKLRKLKYKVKHFYEKKHATCFWIVLVSSSKLHIGRTATRADHSFSVAEQMAATRPLRNSTKAAVWSHLLLHRDRYGEHFLELVAVGFIWHPMEEHYTTTKARGAARQQKIQTRIKKFKLDWTLRVVVFENHTGHSKSLHRSQYKVSDLGPSKFRLGSQVCSREDGSRETAVKISETSSKSIKTLSIFFRKILQLWHSKLSPCIL